MAILVPVTSEVDSATALAPELSLSAGLAVHVLDLGSVRTGSPDTVGVLAFLALQRLAELFLQIRLRAGTIRFLSHAASLSRHATLTKPIRLSERDATMASSRSDSRLHCSARPIRWCWPHLRCGLPQAHPGPAEPESPAVAERTRTSRAPLRSPA